ncbi:MAG: hypothetical protein KDD76_01920, partial [Rickettsiales bacterium]|nr:hypothetical protein [Rickettsiales bacterium]
MNLYKGDGEKDAAGTESGFEGKEDFLPLSAELIMSTAHRGGKTITEMEKQAITYVGDPDSNTAQFLTGGGITRMDPFSKGRTATLTPEFREHLEELILKLTP